jgi:outer membrane receptor protein involved in Fe transport
MRKFGLLGTSAIRSAVFIGMASIMAAPAYAQSDPVTVEDDQGPQETEAAELGSQAADADDVAPELTDATTTGEVITVTGTRIRRPNLSSTVPITSVSAAEILNRGEVSLGDSLNQLPQLRATFSQANSIAGIGTAGLNLLDLRGLGTARTLVLVNGRRHVSAVAGSYVVDVNTIPTDLLERVDVVTGGNSAIYGSDAVAGVVNFILKRNFDGIKIRGQGGVSKYGDRGSYSVSAIAGKNLMDDRVNVAVALEYARSDEVFYADRPYLGAYTGTPGFINAESTATPNRNTNGVPNTTFIDINGGDNPGIKNYIISTGGTAVGICPVENLTNAGVTAQRALVCTGQTTPTGGRLAFNFFFLPDGSLVRGDASSGVIYDGRNLGSSVLGGPAATGVEDAMLLPGLERYAANLLLNADLAPAFKPFLEAKYVRVTATQQNTQPTFVNSTLSPVMSTSNPFLSTAARNTLRIATNNAATFNLNRFNNDIGTRAEDHLRETFRIVAGIGGDLSEKGNLRYEVAFNYGRTETYYETGGNVNVANFNRATQAVLAPAGYAGSNFVDTPNGRAVCAVNANVSTADDDAACVPLNVFGFGATRQNQAALDYVLHVSTRDQWVQQINATAFLSGDTSGFFELPGGPVGFAIGGEYRKEDAYSDYDDVTQGGATFLNAFATFAPPAIEVKEVFGEIRIPLLRDTPFFHELSLEGAARYSDYGGDTGGVWAYNAGAIWAPVRDLRFRATYSQSVRAPTLLNLYNTSGVTFQNNATDPCDQAGGANASNNISNNPNRVANCAAAGVPTTLTYQVPAAGGGTTTVTQPWRNTPGSGLSGLNQGNALLVPEVGKSFTVGAVFQPRFLPGFSLTVDYYRIKVKDVIQSLAGQAVINACYDDPAGIDNVFCAVVGRRASADPLANQTFSGQSSRRVDNIPDVNLPVIGASFISQPFNFAALKTSGIDVDANYRTKINGDIGLSLRAVVSWIEERKNFPYISTPSQFDRIESTLGDPIWQAGFTANVDFGMLDVTYNGRYLGKQIVSGLSYEQFFPSQGRPPLNAEARPFVYYDPIVYHNFRLNFEATKQFRFYMGVDNATNELPPFELTGNESTSIGTSGAIYPNTGRFFYAGAEVKF